MDFEIGSKIISFWTALHSMEKWHKLCKRTSCQIELQYTYYSNRYLLKELGPLLEIEIRFSNVDQNSCGPSTVREHWFRHGRWKILVGDKRFLVPGVHNWKDVYCSVQCVWEKWTHSTIYLQLIDVRSSKPYKCRVGASLHGDYPKYIPGFQDEQL